MGTPGGGATLSFDWLGDTAWTGDFIRPTPAGTLVGTPWVYGDANYANWGVDTADIVLDNADGWSDGTVLMQPGAPAILYATVSISTPVSPDTVSINGNGFGVPASYAGNVLGINRPAQTIVQSWFNSASATGAGNAAAMDPAVEIFPGVFMCDSDDYFWAREQLDPHLFPAAIPLQSLRIGI